MFRKGALDRALIGVLGIAVISVGTCIAQEREPICASVTTARPELRGVSSVAISIYTSVVVPHDDGLREAVATTLRNVGLVDSSPSDATLEIRVQTDMLRTDETCRAVLVSVRLVAPVSVGGDSTRPPVETRLPLWWNHDLFVADPKTAYAAVQDAVLSLVESFAEDWSRENPASERPHE